MYKNIFIFCTKFSLTFPGRYGSLYLSRGTEQKQEVNEMKLTVRSWTIILQLLKETVKDKRRTPAERYEMALIAKAVEEEKMG